MKTRHYFMALSAALIALASCSEDSIDNTSGAAEAIVPEAAISYVATSYPGASAAWSIENDMIKAQLKGNGTTSGTDLWFDRKGKWMFTDVDFRGNTPQAILDYIAANYPGYTIDDVDLITTPDGYYYEIELEKKGSPDVTIYIKEDGTVVNHMDSDNSGNIPAAALQMIEANYPGAQVEWETERGMLKAEVTYNKQELDVWFKTDGTWVATAVEYKGRLNATITQYLTVNYAGYEVDDMHVVTTASDKYYYLELEKKGSPDVALKIREDGTVLGQTTSTTTTTTTTDSNNNGIPAAALQMIEANYKGASVEWERERGMLKAEVTYQGQDIDVWFKTDGTWVATAVEYKGRLNATITQYLTANYTGYEVDDMHVVTTASDKYYYLDLEKKGSPDVALKIREDGTVVQ